MYFRHQTPKHYLEYVVKGKAPVIILPALLSRWGFLKPLGDYISLRGHPTYVVPKLGNNLKDIPRSAELVRDLI